MLFVAVIGVAVCVIDILFLAVFALVDVCKVVYLLTSIVVVRLSSKTEDKPLFTYLV